MVGVDSSESHMPVRLRREISTRLRCIEGEAQVLQRMVVADLPDGELVFHIHQVREAIHCVERLIMRNHLGRCVSAAVCQGDQHVVDDLMHAVEQYIRP